MRAKFFGPYLITYNEVRLYLTKEEWQNRVVVTKGFLNCDVFYNYRSIAIFLLLWMKAKRQKCFLAWRDYFLKQWQTSLGKNYG